MRARLSLAAALLAALVLGCGHAHGPVTGALAEIDRIRVAPGAEEGRRLAPQEYAHAEQERALARQASEQGDDVAASLYAERALAAYQHAFILARLARATDELSSATAALQQAREQERTLAASRADVEREADDLDKKLKIAREALAPVPSGRADPEREAARLVAARSLAMQGRLLCGAARLVSPNIDGLAAAEKAVSDVEGQVGAGAKAAPIDAAARARAGCLTVLTRARRDIDASRGGDADALLSELSANAGWDPSRDERGVVVTLRDVFNGVAVAPDAQKKLADLGRVAATHPAFAVQVVVHDATSPSAHDAADDRQRADAVVAALVAGGASAARTKGETAGARSPVVDPSDAKHRARNARVEIVFVAPGG